MTAFAALSQTYDTVCIPRADAVKLLTKAEQAKVFEERLQIAYTDIALLSQRILEKEKIVADLKSKDSLNTLTIKNLEQEIFIMKDQRKIFEGQLKSDERTIRKLKRKVFWTSVFGLAAAGTLTFLYITK